MGCDAWVRLAVPLAALALALVAAPCGGQDGDARPIAIDGFAFASTAAAQAAWSPGTGAGAVTVAAGRTPDGRPATAFHCQMAPADERAYWDRPGRLDLGRAGRVRLWVRVEGDATAIARATLYVRSGEGWYGASFGVPARGWRSILLERGAFVPEGRPGGWSDIDSVRMGFWKGAQQTGALQVWVGGVEALSSPVVVVRAPSGQDAAREAGQMTALLARAGIDAATVDDADLARGVLQGKRLAVLPYNPTVSDPAIGALEAFVRDGGRLLVCYLLPGRLAALTGVEPTGWRQQEREGQFARIVFGRAAVKGLPAGARQASWNVQGVRPAGRNARVVGWWQDDRGVRQPYPAVVLSDTAAFLSHVVLHDDPVNKERMLRALAGALDPTLWRDMTRRAIEQAGSITPGRARLPAVASEIARGPGGADPRVRREVQAARSEHARAGRLATAGDHPAAIEAAARARDRLTRAFLLGRRARPGEFRGVWCHSAYGPAGITWDTALARLKAAGFNAVVPNMLWGGVADYPSEVLPVRDRVARDGDQIAKCVAAGRKHGIEVHVWKVNWNLMGAPRAFIERLRAEERLQRDSGGREEEWICPSHPLNLALERDSMLEVTRRYDVDGIHFDYIRYPDETKCYCDGCRARFEEQTGAPVVNWPRDVLRGAPRQVAYLEFRRQNITRLVRAVSEGSRRIKPWVKISAAVWPNWPEVRDTLGQDWGAWVREGLLDFVCTMNYTDSNDEFATRVSVQRDEVAGRAPLYPGIGASVPGLPVAQVAEQIEVARRLGADGFILFDYDGVVASDHVPALGLAATRGATRRIARRA
ncbi:MAG TPA: family 10 glycosylhydrolase [Chthonomonadales bacterium]|nr:family 10 glycosylhydrolase [Chthonomonadales bacterium]